MTKTMIGSPYGGDQPGRTIHATITGRLVLNPATTPVEAASDHRKVQPVAVNFRYDPSDPIALTLEFITSPTETVEWVFARSLLIDGVKKAVGEGDVQIWPLGDNVLMQLSSPSGTARFLFSIYQLKTFAIRMMTLVPNDGNEYTQAMLDEACNELLKGE